MARECASCALQRSWLPLLGSRTPPQPAAHPVVGPVMQPGIARAGVAVCGIGAGGFVPQAITAGRNNSQTHRGRKQNGIGGNPALDVLWRAHSDPRSVLPASTLPHFIHIRG